MDLIETQRSAVAQPHSSGKRAEVVRGAVLPSRGRNHRRSHWWVSRWSGERKSRPV